MVSFLFLMNAIAVRRFQDQIVRRLNRGRIFDNRRVEPADVSGKQHGLRFRSKADKRRSQDMPCRKKVELKIGHERLQCLVRHRLSEPERRVSVLDGVKRQCHFVF
jgi:hypothetical protein